MKFTHLYAIRRLKYPEFWLLGIGAGLIAIHGALIFRSNNSNLLGMSFLFWTAVSTLIWEKRHKLNLESGIISSFFGLSLIWLALLKSASLTSFGIFLYILPLIFSLGFFLLASGIFGLKQYKGELLVLFFLSSSKILSSWLTSISAFTAKFSAFILWYTGFEVTLTGDKIILPTGSIEVYSGCSGIELIFQLLGLGLLFLLMFPQNLKYKTLVLIVAPILGFIVNGIRVALMAILVAKSQPEAFKYWHEGDGSLVFSLIAVLVFGLFCWFLLGQSQSQHQDTRSSSR